MEVQALGEEIRCDVMWWCFYTFLIIFLLLFFLFSIIFSPFVDLGAYGTAITETGPGGLKYWTKNHLFDFIIHNGDLV